MGGSFLCDSALFGLMGATPLIIESKMACGAATVLQLVAATAAPAWRWQRIPSSEFAFFSYMLPKIARRAATLLPSMPARVPIALYCSLAPFPFPQSSPRKEGEEERPGPCAFFIFVVIRFVWHLPDWIMVVWRHAARSKL